MKAVLLILLLIAGFFAVQNHEIVEIDFLFWSVTMSRAIVIFLSITIGVLIGWLTPWRMKNHQKKLESDAHE